MSISKIKVGSTEHEIETTMDNVSGLKTALDGKADKTEGIFFVEGTGTTDSTAKTSTWTGTSDRITSYYDGLTIKYKIGVVGQSTVTLDINGLGAKTVYRFNTTKLTTHFPVGSIITLTYHADLNSGCWLTNDYDANTNTYQRVYESSSNVEYPITTRYNTTDGSTYYAEYGRYTNGVTLNPSTNTITASVFKGALTGNADTATKATQDGSGNVIATTYAKKTDIPTVTEFSADADCPNGSVYIGTKDRVLIQGTGDAQVVTNVDGSIISVYVPESSSSVPTATASTSGTVKVSSVNSSAVTVNSESTTEGRYYPVELNNDGTAIVNVPWTDTNIDTKVSAVSTTSSTEYPLLMKYYTGTTTNAAPVRFNTAITANPSTGVITATAFNGPASSVTEGFLAYKTSSASGVTVTLTTGKSYCVGFIYSSVMYTVTMMSHSSAGQCLSTATPNGYYCRYVPSSQALTFINSSGGSLTVTAYYIREL